MMGKQFWVPLTGTLIKEFPPEGDPNDNVRIFAYLGEVSYTVLDFDWKKDLALIDLEVLPCSKEQKEKGEFKDDDDKRTKTLTFIENELKQDLYAKYNVPKLKKQK